MIDFNEVDVEEAEEQVNSLDEDTLRVGTLVLLVMNEVHVQLWLFLILRASYDVTPDDLQNKDFL